MTTEQNELADWRGTFPGQTAGDVIKTLAKEQAERTRFHAALVKIVNTPTEWSERERAVGMQGIAANALLDL